MSLATIKEHIEDRFVANWTGTSIGTNVRFENVPFNTPSTNWVSLDTVFANSVNTAICSNMDTRRNGFIIIDAYATPDTGSKAALTLIDEATAIYENTQFNTIQCLASRPRHIGIINSQGTDSLWYVYRTSIPFYKYS